MPRALIVGGGLAGMGAALFFRRLGHEVLLLEHADRLGSLARGFQRGGQPFETGFHYAGGLEEGGILNRYLSRLGLFEAGLKTRPLPDPGGETLRFGAGDDILLPRGLAAFKSLFPPSAELDRFFDDSAEIVAGSPFLNPGRGRSSDLLALWASGGETLGERLAALGLPERLKALLGFRCLFYGGSPAESWWTDFALVNTPFLAGAHSFEGGGEALARAFEEALARAGVEVRTGQRVTAIEIGDSGFSGLEVRPAGGGDGVERESGDFCVYSGGPAALPGLLPPGALRPALRRRLAGLRPTPPPFLVFASAGVDFCERRQLFLGHGECLDRWLDPDSDLLYLSGGPGHEGRWPVTIIGFLPEADTLAWRGSRPEARPGEYKAFKRRRAEAVVRSVLARCPEFKGDMEIIDSATDLSFGRYCLAHSGGIHGRRHGPGHPPLWPVTRVRGLALAGQDIVLPGLLGTLASAALAVGSLIGDKDKGLMENLKEIFGP